MGTACGAGQSQGSFEDAFPQAYRLCVTCFREMGRAWAFDGHLLSHPLGTGDQAPSALSRPLPCPGTSKTNQGGSLPEGMSGCFFVMLLSEGSRELMNFIKEQPCAPGEQMRLCLKSNCLTPQPEANRAPGVRL